MTRRIKPPARRRRRLAPARIPSALPEDVPAAEAALSFAPAGSPGPPRTDIERVDERRIGGIEAAPHPEPEDGITAFLEPTGDENPELPGT